MIGRSPLFPTRRYGRRLKWRGQDEWGVVELVEGELGLELHFGSSALQGRINLAQPWRPIAEYAVSMAALAALPDPQSRRDESLPNRPAICLLGLGTGSLAWTYHRLIPHGELTAIELRPAVIEVAIKRLGLSQLKGLKLYQGDAADQLAQLNDRSQTLIAIDLFTSEGMAPCLDSSRFWREVSRVLHPCGAVAINTWSGDQRAFDTLSSKVRSLLCPTGDMLIIDHEGFGNCIVLASPRALNREGTLLRADRIDRALSDATPQIRPRCKGWRGQRRGWAEAAKDAGLSGESVKGRLSRAWEASR